VGAALIHGGQTDIQSQQAIFATMRTCLKIESGSKNIYIFFNFGNDRVGTAY